MGVAVGLIFVYRQTDTNQAEEEAESEQVTTNRRSAPLGDPRVVGQDLAIENDSSSEASSDSSQNQVSSPTDAPEGVLEIPRVEEFDEQIELAISSPNRYQVFSVGDTIQVSFNSTALREVQVYVRESPEVCEGDSSCLSQFLAFRQSYSVGARSLNRGYIDIETGSFEPGQYLVEIVDGNTIIGSSQEFAVVSGEKSLSAIVPFENQELSGDGELVRWEATPDVFFVDIFIEGTSRRQIAANKRNDNFFAWDYTTTTGQSVENGSYVMVFEDRFTGEELDRVPFELSKN